MRHRNKAYALPLARTVVLAAFFPLLVATSWAGGDTTLAGAAVGVGAQYDSTHVYVAPGDLDAFINSFVATFGGQPSKRSITNVLPVPSSAEFQYFWTPVGTLSVLRVPDAGTVSLPAGAHRIFGNRHGSGDQGCSFGRSGSHRRTG